MRDGLAQVNRSLGEFHALDIRAHHQQFLAQRAQMRRAQISGGRALAAKGGIGVACAHDVSAAGWTGRGTAAASGASAAGLSGSRFAKYIAVFLEFGQRGFKDHGRIDQAVARL